MFNIVVFFCILLLKDLNGAVFEANSKSIFEANLKSVFEANPKYEDFYFFGQDENANVTYMMMPEDNGIVVSAILGGAVPKTENDKKIELMLWTRKTGNIPERITYTTNTTKGLKFKNLNLSKKIIILIHGFIDRNFESDFFKVMREVLLRKDDCNVIAVDWSNLSQIPWYAEAVKNSHFAGLITAKAITDLINLKPANPPHIHIITFNLGGLVAQAASLYLDTKIDRITGLDPPYILTNELPPDRKLNRKSAKVVEIIHTSGDYLGINEHVGHRDFYPNGGKWPQPGCFFDIADRCSSRLAFIYYAKAILGKNNYVTTRCHDYESYLQKKCFRQPKIRLFNDVSHSLQGKFFFSTS